jgi:hypothetical protein
VDPLVAVWSTLAFQGFVGPIEAQSGGYDYHGNGEATKITRDTEAGNAIGAALQIAAARQKPAIVVVLTSNGSVSSNIGNGSPAPRSDAGQFVEIIMFAYDPNGNAQLAKTQLGGGYTANGVTPNDTAWSGSPDTATKVLLANYFFLINDLASFNDVNQAIAFAAPFFTS